MQKPSRGDRHPPVRTDATTRAAYTSDAGLYRRWPAAVAEPGSVAQVRAAIAAAREQGWPVVPRGGGTSVAGNAVSTGMVLDHSRFHNRIVAIDPVARTARVQPGVICDTLREAARAHGLTYGPDPSTHSRATIGGMVANNACGSHSVAWGTSAQNLTTVRLILADGREIAAGRGWCSDPVIEDALRTLVAGNEELIRRELGRFPRQVSGYGLHHLLPEHGFDVAKALAGSEGTLGVFTELTVALVEPPAATALLVLAYDDPFAAAAAAPRLRVPGVLTVEGMGADLVAALRTRPGREDAGRELPPGGAWLYCDVAGADPQAAQAAAESLLAAATARGDDPGDDDPATVGGAVARGVVVTDPAACRALWKIREDAAGITTRRADGGEAWPGWEDSAVPPENLSAYLRDLYTLMDRQGLQGIPFGHFGEGCVHVRIDFDLATAAGVDRYRAFIASAAELVVRYGGSVSGEHGDGRARSELLATMYSPEMLALFRRFKTIFDPDGVFNPGVLVDPEPLDDDLRPGPGLRSHDVTTVHALHGDGGSFARAVTRCVGVGLCRDASGGMCPSYQATKDEVASTRGRARVLAEMVRGEHLDGWRSTAAREALDLCLSCKACATECPVNVDMATYKSEFLHRHYAGRIRPRAHYSMGWLPVVSAAVSAAPGLGPLANRMFSIRPVERLALRAAGVEPRRRMIPFASMSFVAWWRNRRRDPGARPENATPVVLWPDTFNNHHSPQIAIAATRVLEALGCEVVVPTAPVCCGLTWHSTGQLDMTRRVLRRTLDVLAPHLAEGRDVVVLEPSCAVMLADAAELFPDDARAVALGTAVHTLGEFVDARTRQGGAVWPFTAVAGSGPLVTQVHCHQRARRGFEADRRVLGRLGWQVDEVGAGCCGLAGNWGFEPGHFEVSQACAERELYPKVRAGGGARARVAADGFSCRTQVGQGTGAQARHLAELLARALPGRGHSHSRGRGVGDVPE
ncbi:FAD/FMN-containing dehydrogenase [Austwickia chelonae]|uniref:Putative FAD-linked oxidase n=1 Tax=Austwickia chelonae NBRC 105200 TaxID=1184607 RepID=K6VVI3_9MICO|nr:FAD-binding and (Fe-S)-binding domain-containing protein [Austwickia chelonae]GAB79355.1 putative FAD-linked oxidase [Austwickia chelonae NBRC 105200]SEW43951.1 FAD/FMN-containing dehydrogenase [Austwickia chelonae]